MGSLYSAIGHMKKGALHSQLGVPQGEKIPASKMAAAKAGRYGPLAQRRADFAGTLEGLSHKKRAVVNRLKKG